MSVLERDRVTLGFVPLNDCAPLVVAQHQGYFREEGLDVALSRESSWANIRDKVILGALDGAHMPAPMPLAASLGIAGPCKPMLTPCVLNLNGNAITVSEALYQRMARLAPESLLERPVSAQALRRVLEADRRSGRRPLRFATVFPTSTHHYQLRYWLNAAGIDPDRDLQLVVIPPPQMAAAMEAGAIAGCCVGEPWNSYIIHAGVGRALISSYEIWNNSAEKVLGFTETWAQQHPRTLTALVRAVLRACAWLDRAPEHRIAAAKLLARPGYVDASLGTVMAGLGGAFRYTAAEVAELDDFVVFHRYAANFPWRSQALWFAQQMARCEQLPPGADVETAIRCSYRPDLFAAAAQELGLPVPSEDSKPEGVHSGPWRLRATGGTIAMGADRFFDGSALAASATGAGTR